MGIIVQKFGGSSVADAERIKRVAKRVVETKKLGHKVVAVVSAMGDNTDHLISLARQVSDAPSEREMDMLLATGEQVSIALLAMAIQSMGEAVISLTGPQAGIKTNNTHSKAKILDISSERLHQELDQGKIVIVAGFQGATINDEITTLGRGGSDTTAAAIAAALKADVCEIFTDVDGVYATDPRVVPNIKKLDTVSFDEMLELASLGAKVLQPRAVEFAKLYNVKLHVRSSFNYNQGTIVQEVNHMEKEIVVSGVAHDFNAVKMAVFGVPDKPGMACKIFKTLAEHAINVDMIVQSAKVNGVNDIAFTIEKQDMEKAKTLLEKISREINARGISCTDNIAKVSIVGAGMITNPGVAADMFEALAEANINLEMISTSEIKVSVIIEANDCIKAVKKLVEKFNLQDSDVATVAG
ncbi:aspartate kinase [Desulfitibacter alkalitolerans]|uniref:aspartate kinase n=1 Tax=Desulfitibacter alkalitolerans TaxID=264641 RepID=UPI00048476B0|nr:aspartate kinase [Desulfitibacter alkalitolerans]